ncbi:MAG: hypothetical protein V5A44_03150 [Haloarculaceae archaeon]
MSDEDADENGWSPTRRAAVMALWTWVAFAGLAGVAFVASGGMGEGWPTGYLGGVLSVLTFGFGVSAQAGGPAFVVALTSLGPTLVLVLEVVVLTALLYRGLVALGEGDELAGQVGLVLAYLGAVPAVAWVIGFLWVGGSTPLPVGGLAGSATGPLSYWPAALALSIPLAAAFGRLRLRAAERRDWVLDGWLFVSWLLGSLVVVEAAAGVDGLGTLALRGGVNDDFPVLLSALALFVVFALLASVGRELAWSSTDGGVAARAATEADGGSGLTRAALLRDVVTESPRVKVGLVGLGLSVLVGGVAMAVVAPAAATRGPVWAVPLALAAVAPTALLAWVVATATGVGLGLVATRASGGRTVAGGAWFVANVPLLVWFYLTVVATDASTTTPAGLPTAVLAVSVAPLVGVVVASALAGAGEASAAAAEATAPTASAEQFLPVVGTAAVCAAVVVLVVAQARGLAGIAPSGELWAVFATRRLSGIVLRFGLGVGIPVVSLLLVGDGLREYVREQHTRGPAKPDWVDR